MQEKHFLQMIAIGCKVYSSIRILLRLNCRRGLDKTVLLNHVDARARLIMYITKSGMWLY